jgi:hypothetical protein
MSQLEVMKVAKENLIAQIRLATLRHENVKIVYNTYILKASQHAIVGQQLKIYQLLPKTYQKIS